MSVFPIQREKLQNPAVWPGSHARKWMAISGSLAGPDLIFDTVCRDEAL